MFNTWPQKHSLQTLAIQNLEIINEKKLLITTLKNLSLELEKNTWNVVSFKKLSSDFLTYSHLWKKYDKISNNPFYTEYIEREMGLLGKLFFFVTRWPSFDHWNKFSGWSLTIKPFYIIFYFYMGLQNTNILFITTNLRNESDCTNRNRYHKTKVINIEWEKHSYIHLFHQ